MRPNVLTKQSRMVNEPSRMPSTIPVHDYERKRLAFLGMTLSGAILWTFCPTSLQAIGGAAKKTDADLAKAVIGTWENPVAKNPFAKQFLAFSVDGTCKAIAIINDHGSARRTEGEATWRVNRGYLILKAVKTTPSNHGIRIRLNSRDQIESIENGIAKLRDENGDESEMRRIPHLPSLPPLLTDARPARIYAPPPEYPSAALRRGWTGSGLFACNLRPDGSVASVAVIRSTGHDMLDQAGISALRRWKFKPGVTNVVRVPMRFTMGGVRHRMSGAVISD
jgi:TonB family protein